MPATRTAATASPRKSRSQLTPRSPNGRSRVSNGKDILPGVDQRSAIARRYRDLVAGVIGDMGGIDQCSEAKLQLIRRTAALSVQLEDLEARLIEGNSPIDIGEYATLTSTLVRVVSRLGIRRVAKNITPDLQTYLEKEREDAA